MFPLSTRVANDCFGNKILVVGKRFGTVSPLVVEVYEINVKGRYGLFGSDHPIACHVALIFDECVLLEHNDRIVLWTPFPSADFISGVVVEEK